MNRTTSSVLVLFMVVSAAPLVWAAEDAASSASAPEACVVSAKQWLSQRGFVSSGDPVVVLSTSDRHRGFNDTLQVIQV